MKLTVEEIVGKIIDVDKNDFDIINVVSESIDSNENYNTLNYIHFVSNHNLKVSLLNYDVSFYVETDFSGETRYFYILRIFEDDIVNYIKQSERDQKLNELGI